MGPVSSFVDFNPLGFLQKLVCMIKKYSTQTFPKPGSVFATTKKMRRTGQKVSKEEEEEELKRSLIFRHLIYSFEKTFKGLLIFEQ